MRLSQTCYLSNSVISNIKKAGPFAITSLFAIIADSISCIFWPNLNTYSDSIWTLIMIEVERRLWFQAEHFWSYFQNRCSSWIIGVPVFLCLSFGNDCCCFFGNGTKLGKNLNGMLLIFIKSLILLVGRRGFEPRTYGLRVHSSASWANGPNVFTRYSFHKLNRIFY